MAQSPILGQASRPKAYHQFLDREYPDDYRREEIQALIRAIRARENRLLLGLPGMGTSNLLRFLVARADLMQCEVTFAYLNCDALDDCLDLEIFFETIAGQFHEQGLGGPPEMSERGYERLRRLVTQVGGDPSSRVVIVVDQANALLATMDRTFYRKLKALTDLNKRVCYIFAANPLAAAIIDPDDLLFAGGRLTMGRLNERDCADAMVREARRLEVEFNPAIQQGLKYLSGCHPGLLRAVASAIAKEGLDLLDPEQVALVERLLARDNVVYRCRKVWHRLDPAKQAALQSLTRGQPDLATEDTLAWLRNFGLVDESEGQYRLFSPLFAGFVASQKAPLEPITIEGASENEHGIIVAGRVFKGSREVHVAPLELKLIACLKRERKIYSKDEIAAYVYYEDEIKGKGVSESAIENLVRQVRKRLGDHRYIKAHWGQGYEFLG